MDGVAQGWLVYELTGSALSLGWVSAARSVTMLIFSLYGGVLCDRFQKRSILFWVRAARLVTHVAIAVLVSAGAIRVWHVALRSLLSGMLVALIVPAERAIVPELVDREMLLNAVSLTSIATGLMGILAAGVAGFLIDLIGVGGVYYAIVVFHVLTMIVVAQLPTTDNTGATSTSVWSDLVRGVRYVLQRRELTTLLIFSMALAVFARPYQTFMPKFAKEVMGFQAAGLGLLMAAPEMGSLVSSLIMASLKTFRKKGWLLLTSGIALGLSLVVFANLRFLPLVVLFLALIGAMNSICLITNQTLSQTYSSDGFQGRVMSLNSMMGGLTMLGTLPAGAIADWLGVPIAVSMLGILLVVVCVGIVCLKPGLRRLA